MPARGAPLLLVEMGKRGAQARSDAFDGRSVEATGWLLEREGRRMLELAPEDVMVGTEQAADWVTVSDGSVQIALSTKLTPELVREGVARDFVRQIQQMRKDAGLEIEDRIAIRYSGDSDVAAAIEAFGDYIRAETLADSLQPSNAIDDGQTIRIGETAMQMSIRRI